MDQDAEKRFFSEANAQNSTRETNAAARLLQWARDRKLGIWWGGEDGEDCFAPYLDRGGERYFLFTAWAGGRVEVDFQYMKGRPVFDSDGARRELMDRFNEIIGIEFPLDSLNRRPSVPLIILSSKTVMEQFLAVWEWYLARLAELA
ncbi:MAG: hypothetical protein P8018_04270 [Acidobacteriota bacterium]|jgi:hypothetical protein